MAQINMQEIEQSVIGKIQLKPVHSELVQLMTEQEKSALVRMVAIGVIRAAVRAQASGKAVLSYEVV